MKKKMENKPKTAKEVLDYVDNTYLLALLEHEYQVQKDTEFQLEYLDSKEGRNMFGSEKVDASLPELRIALERAAGRVKFLLTKFAIENSKPLPEEVKAE